ncbi:chitobiase/beta-hexosaminidase C-terminal domain-containing protein, partial [Chloroflexota bacterium]
ARVTQIGLLTQGMEDIISAIVQPKKESPEWKQYVQSQGGKFTWFSGECNRLRLFSWLPAPKIKNNIIQNIYPMHPMATYALLKLAGEAGSDNRSVFKFFAPEFETGEKGWKNVQPQSYPWFLENHEVTEDNKLALYTADFLVDYFKESLIATNNRLADKVKAAVINYGATLRELNAYLSRKSENQLFEEADDLMLKIIKVMLVNEIASNQEAPIANTPQNIEFGLDLVAPDEKQQVENRLKLLSDAGILYNNNGVYELMRGDRKDIQRLVEQFKANPDNRPTNLLSNFLELHPLKKDEIYLEAKGYNDPYSEDKRLKVFFASPDMLLEKHTINGEEMTYFSFLEHERKQNTSGTSGYEGSAVYVFCENENDIDKAKKAVSKNKESRTVVAIPRNPINVFDAIFSLKAMASEWFRAQSQDFGPFEKAEEKRIRDDATKELDEAKKSYFSNAKVYWFGVIAKEIPVADDKSYDVARCMMQDLYTNKRNTFGHNELNKMHINISGQVRAVFKEAGDILCDTSQPIRVNWTWADNRGGTKYLRKCFADHQILKVTSKEGDTRYLEPEKDLNKFKTTMPAYAKLLEELENSEGKGHINLVQFLKPYNEEYGQGDIAITLMLLLACRFYGDSLRFKREPGNLMDLHFSTTEEMLSLVQGQYPSAIFLFEPVSSEDQSYFAKITQTFTEQPAPAGKVYTITEAFEAITNWWNSLPIIARSLPFYDIEDKPIAEALSQAKTKDPFRFIKYDLLSLLGQSPGEILTAAKLVPIEVRFKTFKAAAQAVQSFEEEKILNEFAKVFVSSSSLDVDIQESMRNWYNSLSTSQRDHVGNTFHNNDSKPLVKFTAYADIRELLFKTLPDAYALGSIDTWMSDFTPNYIERVKKGKEHIETNAPNISKLVVDFGTNATQNGKQVTYKGELNLHAETVDGEGVIYYTEDGSDPTKTNQSKKLIPGDALTFKGNRKVKFVVSDGKGNFSSVQAFDLIDELQKYLIKRPEQHAFEETISFVFPPDKEKAQTTITSFIKTLKESGYYSKGELKKVIQDILDSMK